MEPSKFSPSLLVFPLLLFVVILLASLPQSTAQNLTRGMSLSSSISGLNSSLVSPSGDFAFGFWAYNSKKSLFLLAIWFYPTSPQHVIWFAMNAGNLILAPLDSTLGLNPDGFLALKIPNGTQIWSSNRKYADHAALLDSGNFVICKTICDSKSSPLWESFQSPTDTIVPGQTLLRNQMLWSKLTDTDFSQGRFNLIVQSNNDLVLYPISLPYRNNYHALWRPTSENCEKLVFNSNGSFYCQYGNISVNVTSSVAISTLDYYQHATVDPDGLFRIYAYAKKNAAGWDVIAQNYPDGCFAWNLNNTWRTGEAGGGICGVNGYCSLNDPNQTRVHCKCPQYYSVIDPDNIYKGCKPDFDVQQCGSARETIEFEVQELPNNIDWQSDDYEWYHTFSEDQCKENCLKDCSCAVAIHKSNGNRPGCHKKSLPLQLGIERNIFDGKVFIKVPRRKDEFHIGRVAGVILLVAASILLVIVVFLATYLWHAFKKSPRDLSISAWINLREFTYKELEGATNNFNEMLGHGSFGSVYKGVLTSDPPKAIAVKVLNPLKNNREREFESEVHSIRKTHHKNLIKLIGFCTEGSKMMLVYDYMNKGSLEKYTKRIDGEKLTWDIRAKVGLGIAKGLQYLHEDCDPPVIHCDIKPQNILLDDKYVAKITDFGVAKLLWGDQTYTSTQGRGTPGYIAPEWVKGEQVTKKVDVYSFGALLVEIIFCTEDIKQQANQHVRAGTVSQAVEQLMKQLVQLMGDEEDEANIQSMQEFVEVAVTCLQEDPNKRPTMCDVACILSHAIRAPAPADEIPTPVAPEPETLYLTIGPSDDAIRAPAPADEIPTPVAPEPETLYVTIGPSDDAIPTPEQPIRHRAWLAFTGVFFKTSKS